MSFGCKKRTRDLSVGKLYKVKATCFDLDSYMDFWEYRRRPDSPYELLYPTSILYPQDVMVVMYLGSEITSSFCTNDTNENPNLHVLFFKVLIKDRVGYLLVDSEYLRRKFNVKITFELIKK